jgi:hypothetical protein
MKQHEAVIKVMEENGGYATLGHLYQNVLKVPDCEWKTKTPFASMRRIVQDDRFFFKIKPGLWALKSQRHLLPDEMLAKKEKTPKQIDFTHSYYQGLIVQLGNLQEYETFIPSQDKNKLFLGKERLGNLASRTDIYPFTYDNVTSRAQTIDVVWFNSRKMPASVFEVEHSTDMKNSLVKFVELQDFRTGMIIVADESRKKQYEQTIMLNAFIPIKNYVYFWSYQQLSKLHSKSYELKVIKDTMREVGRWRPY